MTAARMPFAPRAAGPHRLFAVHPSDPTHHSQFIIPYSPFFPDAGNCPPNPRPTCRNSFLGEHTRPRMRWPAPTPATSLCPIHFLLDRRSPFIREARSSRPPRSASRRTLFRPAMVALGEDQGASLAADSMTANWIASSARPARNWTPTEKPGASSSSAESCPVAKPASLPIHRHQTGFAFACSGGL